ncbi:MAG: hypothetical protein ACFFCP_05710 [Promethearchaeota archaeon]
MVTKSTMIRFIQLLPQVSLKGDFLLKDLPGSGRRIDVLCRDLAACYSWGPITWPREDIELVAIIADTLLLTFSYPAAATPQSEAQWGAVIKHALEGQSPDYVQISEGTLRGAIERFNKPPTSKLWVLEEGGRPMSSIWIEKSITKYSFMLGNHKGFNSQTESLMSKYELPRVSLGDISYLSSHCIASILSEFEKAREH